MSNFFSLPCSDSKLQYYCVAETRNNLSAALQNLQGAQRYLQNIDFPYCTPSEIATVSKVRLFQLSIHRALLLEYQQISVTKMAGA